MVLYTLSEKKSPYVKGLKEEGREVSEVDNKRTDKEIIHSNNYILEKQLIKSNNIFNFQ